jgi:hypothetical protein
MIEHRSFLRKDSIGASTPTMLFCKAVLLLQIGLICRPKQDSEHSYQHDIEGVYVLSLWIAACVR